MWKHRKWFQSSRRIRITMQIPPVRMNDFIELDSFHTAIWPVLAVARCFGVMPLTNIVGPSPYRVQFKYASVWCATTAFFLFSGSLIFLLLLGEIMQAGINGKNFVEIVFFISGLNGCVLFARLAIRWPDLLRYWTRVETTFLCAPYKPPKRLLRYKIRVLAFTVAFFCVDPPASYEDFMKQKFKYVFVYVPYSIEITFLVLALNTMFSFLWNYMDLFIALISLCLATRFEQIGQRTESMIGLRISEDIWYEIRMHYVQLCELLEVVDDQLSSIILLSSASNLYFICTQILNIFNALRWRINYIYFWYSLSFIIGRALMVFFCASKINEQSRVPLKALRLVPANGWGNETERFSVHITGECIALTGRRFFYVTRKLLFGMAATILTYELVLLQLIETNKDRNLPPLCT